MREDAIRAVADILSTHCDARHQFLRPKGLTAFVAAFTAWRPSSIREHAGRVLTLMYNALNPASDSEKTFREDILRVLADQISTNSPIIHGCPAIKCIMEICKADHTARQRFVSLNVLQPLIALLTHERVICQEQAVTTVADICSTDCDAREQMLRLDGLPSLIQLLASSSLQCQEQAATALAFICIRNDARRQFVELGGVEPIRRLLASYSAQCHEQAARVWAMLNPGS
ncbi:hypothetical protein WJX74_010604 [Apatococcus lobatus]|uniref:U-box domain-containing protein n=1 Tax=Apatococcus lobatus TaxID=904363 RepID=A0AAW1QAA7_9CHLO